jgi:hypothetical protein
MKNMMKIMVFWDVIQYSFVQKHQHSEEICYHLQGRKANCMDKTETRSMGEPTGTTGPATDSLERTNDRRERIKKCSRNEST